jgi:hypothetical protein
MVQVKTMPDFWLKIHLTWFNFWGAGHSQYPFTPLACCRAAVIVSIHHSFRRVSSLPTKRAAISCSFPQSNLRATHSIFKDALHRTLTLGEQTAGPSKAEAAQVAELRHASELKALL